MESIENISPEMQAFISIFPSWEQKIVSHIENDSQLHSEVFKIAHHLTALYRQELNDISLRRTRDYEFIDERTRWCSETNKLLGTSLQDEIYRTVIGRRDRMGRVPFGPNPPAMGKLTRSDRKCWIGSLSNEANNNDLKSVSAVIVLSDIETPSSVKIPINGPDGSGKPEFIPLHLLELSRYIYSIVNTTNEITFVCSLETEEEASYWKKLLGTLTQKYLNHVQRIHLIVSFDNPRAIFKIANIIRSLQPFITGVACGNPFLIESSSAFFMKEDPNYPFTLLQDDEFIYESLQVSAFVKVLSWVAKLTDLDCILPMFDRDVGDEVNTESQADVASLIAFYKFLLVASELQVNGLWFKFKTFARLANSILDKQNFINKELIHNSIREKITDPEQQSQLLSFGMSNLSTKHSIIDAEIDKVILGIQNIDEEADMSGTESNILFKSLIGLNNEPVNISTNELIHISFQLLFDWLVNPSESTTNIFTLETLRFEARRRVKCKGLKLNSLLKIIIDVWELRSQENKESNNCKWIETSKNSLIQMIHGTDLKCSKFLFPFLFTEIRNETAPYEILAKSDPSTYQLDRFCIRFITYYSAVREERFALSMARSVISDDTQFVKNAIRNFTAEQLNKVSLAQGCLSYINENDDPELVNLGKEYEAKFGARFISPTLIVLIPNSERKDFELIKQQITESLNNDIETELERVKKSIEVEAMSKLEPLLGTTDDERLITNMPITSGKDLRSRLKTRTSTFLLVHSGALDTTNAAAFGLPKRSGKPIGFLELANRILKELNVPGASISLLTGLGMETKEICIGFADLEKQAPVRASTYFEMCSLSKTVGVAFALEYLKERNIPLQTSVNKLLDKYSSKDWRLRSAPGMPEHWGDLVTVEHLITHRALGLHYVNGFPLEMKRVPPMLDLLTGKYTKEGYPATFIEREPGATFKYSGGGFLMLEYLLLEMSGQKSIEKLFRPFLDALGLKEFTFDQQVKRAYLKQASSLLNTNVAVSPVASGYLEDGISLAAPGGRLMFPALAAGALATPRAMARFMAHLVTAYNDVNGSGPISHDTACQMYYAGRDSGEQREFMATVMGLGIFIAEAGSNLVGVHQAANDGFRGMYVVAHRGPYAGSGFVLMNNGSNNGVQANGLIAQQMLRRLGWDGVDLSSFEGKRDFDASRFTQEQIVNMGYKELVFHAFQQDLPEVPQSGPVHPLSKYNLLRGAKLLVATDQKLARATNIISDTIPSHSQLQYGRNGRLFDSWQSSRHNPREYDYALFALASPAVNGAKCVEISTAYHDGDHAPYISIDAIDSKEAKTFVLLQKKQLSGHSIHRFYVERDAKDIPFDQVKVVIYPDGGLARVMIFEKLLSHELSYPSVEGYQYPVPKSDPYLPIYESPSIQSIKRAWEIIDNRDEKQQIDIACVSYGSKILYATQKTWQPATSIISSFKPRGQFDGFHTPRSRVAHERKCACILLAKPAVIERVVIDMTYYLFNNPVSIAILGCDSSTYEGIIDDDNQWYVLVPPTFIKPFAGNVKEIIIDKEENKRNTVAVKVYSYPDGGYNRIHFFTSISRDLLDAPLCQEFVKEAFSFT